MTEERRVEPGIYQVPNRRALAARGEVALAEVADHGRGRSLGEEVPVPKLQARPPTPMVPIVVPHGLPVAAD